MNAKIKNTDFILVKTQAREYKDALRAYLFGANGNSGFVPGSRAIPDDFIDSLAVPGHSLTHEAEKLRESNNLLSDKALRLVNLYHAGQIEDAQRGLELFDLKAQNLLLQLELLEGKLNNNVKDVIDKEHVTSDELAEAVQDLNTLYEEKDRVSQSQLRNSEGKFRLLADSIPQFIWTLDLHGKIDYFNESMVRYSGYTAAELAAGSFSQTVHPEDVEENHRRWERSLKTGEDFEIEHRLRRHDGEYRWYYCKAVAQRDEQGDIVLWIGTSTDMHEQRISRETLEMLVEERTRELKKANAELETMNKELSSFAYVSSHDLQEPLRKIQTYGSMIVANELQNLSESGKKNFERMRHAAARMSKLINDLLMYSRTNAAQKALEPTDLKALINEVATDFAEVLEARGGTLSIGSMPVINAVPFQARQLFINLISNAVKFAKEDVPPVIEIISATVKGTEINHESAIGDSNYLHIRVSDNGIGFSPEYATTIFEAFQRLHGKSEYEGTGIGLAICAKIVENHNGIITATSSPGEGATFNIYLPL